MFIVEVQYMTGVHLWQPDVHMHLTLQEQYIFVHDAILEVITCVDTQIIAGGLWKSMQKLSHRDPDTHLTGYDTQFMASHVALCEFCDGKCESPCCLV